MSWAFQIFERLFLAELGGLTQEEFEAALVREANGRVVDVKTGEVLLDHAESPS